MHLSERYLRRYYQWDTMRRWQTSRHPPEWFDHRADLYQFSRTRHPHWAERGVYSRELVQPGDRVLDLCCGDGFYPFHFYAETADHIDAVDRDPAAVAHASRYHTHPNIRYSQMDVAADPFPGASYDVVVWDAAIEHFPAAAIQTILAKIALVLAPDGVLSGYTILNDGPLMHPDHAHEFPDAGALTATLRQHFAHVTTFETTYPDRRNIYFRARQSDDSSLANSSRIRATSPRRIN